MDVLVVGASGATGRLLVEALLSRGRRVKAIVRSPGALLKIPDPGGNLTIIRAGIADITDAELAGHVQGCDAVASCLGHNLTFKGMFGHPRRLVTGSVRRLCRAISAAPLGKPVRFVLMGSAGVRNRGLHEPVSLAHRCVVLLLRILIPPHADNEMAAECLRTDLGPNNGGLEWAVVRPDSLIDADTAGEYDLHESPIRSAIFDSGRTSRINVAHFMADLITRDDLWREWKGRMPVIYNRVST